MKAIIEVKDKQYLVTKGDRLAVDLLNSDDKSLAWEPLLVIDGQETLVGEPTVSGISVTAQIIEDSRKQAKVTAIRYRAKKRIHKVRGHRQQKTIIEITDIVKKS